VLVTAEPRVEDLATMAAGLDRLNRMSGRLHAAVAAELDITVGQLAVLQAVAAGDRQVREVAATCGHHVSSASRTVDQLVSLGVVSRTEDPTDRRAVRLALTAAGERLTARLDEVSDGLLADITADLADDEVRDLARLVQRFADGAARAVGPRAEQD
jgi:MarR family transcriptional regulator, transcriptional regulator for hemolysin